MPSDGLTTYNIFQECSIKLTLLAYSLPSQLKRKLKKCQRLSLRNWPNSSTKRSRRKRQPLVVLKVPMLLEPRKKKRRKSNQKIKTTTAAAATKEATSSKESR